LFVFRCILYSLTAKIHQTSWSYPFSFRFVKGYITGHTKEVSNYSLFRWSLGSQSHQTVKYGHDSEPGIIVRASISINLAFIHSFIHSFISVSKDSWILMRSTYFIFVIIDCFCCLVINVPGCSPRGPEFDSRRYPGFLCSSGSGTGST
jgi:hypothetical protein